MKKTRLPKWKCLEMGSQCEGAQLNDGRHLEKRPTELVLQPFDVNMFNFTEVGQEEELFTV